MEARRYIQIASVAFSMISAIYLIIRARNIKARRPFLIAPVIFLIHIAVYYSAIFLFIEHDLDADLGFVFSANSWSAGLTFHAVITVVYLSYALIKLLPGGLKHE